MKRETQRRARREIAEAARSGLDWLSFAALVNEVVLRTVPFDRACWHPVDPGTCLFTGLLGQNMTCSSAWLAKHEYVIDDVNKWADLARSGQRAAALSRATGGVVAVSARARSSNELGMPVGDELRAAFVADDIYWAAAGFIRSEQNRWFDEKEVRFLADLSSSIAEGFRRAVVVSDIVRTSLGDLAPGVVVLDGEGDLVSISAQAERWLADIVEEPPAAEAHRVGVVQAVAARARCPDDDPNLARARAQTRSGRWLLLYGTRLSGGASGRTAVIVQPAGPLDVAPLVAQAYGLSDRERDVTRLCFRGLTTREIAALLHVSPYTVQDHLKSIFSKTGTRSRAELVGQVFLEHYVPRFEETAGPAPDWNAQTLKLP